MTEQQALTNLKGETEMNIETIARAIDPEAWTETIPVPTRADTEEFHARRQRSVEKARAIMASLEQQPAEPDLLEELQAASNYIDTLGGVSQRYRAAIAKATGEQA